MSAKSGNYDGSAIAIEARVLCEGDLCPKVEASKKVSCVVCLAHSFSSVTDSAVAQHKSDTSKSEILAVMAFKSTVHKRSANSVILPAPGFARKISPQRKRCYSSR